MKNYLLLLSFLTLNVVFAQDYSGINTTDPKASLDVVGAPTDASVTEGVIAPRLTREQLIAKTNYGVEQTGAIVYVTEINGTKNTVTENVNTVGYYYFDGSIWHMIVNKQGWLDKVTEGGNTGYRIRGVDAANYGDIGKDAVDLSINYTGAYVDPNYPSPLYGAIAPNSFAIGYNNTANGEASAVMGYGNLASGDYSIATGFGTSARGDSSTSFGIESHATGMCTIAMGVNSNAEGSTSFAGGSESEASGHTSFSFGSSIYAKGAFSVALGRKISADSQSSIALGVFSTIENNPDSNNFTQNNNRLLVLGNGDVNISASDAFTVLRDARVGIDIDNFENTTSDAKLQVNGDVKISGITKLDPQSITAGSACDNGSIGYGSDGEFYGCKGGNWKKFTLN